MKNVFTLGLLVCLTAALGSAVHAPSVGFVRQMDGNTRTYYGIHANLIPGELLFSGVRSASFSDHIGLLSTVNGVDLVSTTGAILGHYDTNESQLILNVEETPESAIAWLPDRRKLLLWNHGQFEPLPVPDTSWTGKVTSLRKIGTSSAELLVTANNGPVSQVLVTLNNGSIQSVTPMPGIQGPVFHQKSFLLFHDERGIEVQGPDGRMRTIPIQEPDPIIERMSSDWLHIQSVRTNRDWAVHLTDSTLEFSELPITAGESSR